MAKQATKAKAKQVAKESATIDIVDSKREMSLPVSRHLPIVTINRESVSAIFGLEENTASKKLAFRNDKGELVDIGQKNVKVWMKRTNGWNVGNRPVDAAHVKYLASLMETDRYYKFAGNMLVIADSPHRDSEAGEKCVANSQHTCAAYALTCSEGKLSEHLADGIELILIDEFDDDLVDLLDTAKRRTPADALARRGIAEEKTSKILQSVVRFLIVRYRDRKEPTSAKERIEIRDAVNMCLADERFKPCGDVMSCLSASNAKTEVNSKGKATIVAGSRGSLTLKGKAGTKSDFPRFGLPLAWWTLAGTVLVNGGKCTPDEFAAWANKLAFSSEKSLNAVEMNLRDALETHGDGSARGTQSHWNICRSVIHAFIASHTRKVATVSVEYSPLSPDFFINDVTRKETAKLGKNLTGARIAGLLLQGLNDVLNASDGAIPELEPYAWEEETEDDETGEDEDDETGEDEDE